MLRAIRLLFCFLVLLPAASFAAPAQYAFRVSFRDKAGAPALSEASTWLSTRSLDRRTKFGIALDSTDRPVSRLYLDTILALSGAKLHNTSRWLNQCVVLLNDSSQVAALRAKSWVKSIEWVGYFAFGLHKDALPVNPKPKSEALVSELDLQGTAARQAANVINYGATSGQTNMVHGDTLHDQGFRGAGKLIAVLDAGFYGVDSHRGFDSMRNQGRLLETYNFLFDTSFVYAYDDHGTHCLSTIAGLIPNEYVGTATSAQFALYVTEDASVTDALYELDNLVAGMERADSLGADIISASLGYNTFVFPRVSSFDKSELDGHTTIVAQAANLATAKGILYVCSAGNEGGNNWNYIVSPADADSALTVGAVNPSRVPAGFSSPGPNAAGLIKPEVCLQGDPAVVLTAGGGIGTAGGTSFSTPQAAGYAACLMQQYPNLPPAFFRLAFVRIAHLYPSSTPKLGYGIPDFGKAKAYLDQFVSTGEPKPLVIYPNPFREIIRIELPGTGTISEVQMHDILGRRVRLTESRNGNYLVLGTPNSVGSGIYFLNVQVDGKRYVHKMVHY
jgi:serine protease AprX